MSYEKYLRGEYTNSGQCIPILPNISSPIGGGFVTGANVWPSVNSWVVVGDSKATGSASVRTSGTVVGDCKATGHNCTISVVVVGNCSVTGGSSGATGLIYQGDCKATGEAI